VLTRLSGIRRDERGVVMVLFAVVLPVVLLMGVIAVDIGNWFVHQKRLQTLADASVLAGGGSFTGCGQDMAATNLVIKNAALNYAGDTTRDSATRNQQEQHRDNDDHVVLNSKDYWAEGDPTDGSTRDWTWVAPYTPSDTSKPCQTKALDVKETEKVVPLLFGLIPVQTTPHARARVEIRQVESVTGLLPFAVPEVAPAKVGVVIFDENGSASSPASVRGAAWLANNTPSPPPDLSAFNTWDGDLAGVNLNGSENFNTIIVISRWAGASLNGSLQTICTQNPVQVTCYGKGWSLNSGLSFIHAYSDGTAGSAQFPRIRQAVLVGGCGTDFSSPYFNLNGGCSMVVQAKIDFGVSGDPRIFPTCAVVPGYTWSAGGLGGALGTWTQTGGFSPSAGRNDQSINNVETLKTGASCPGSRTYSTDFPKVASAYLANPTGSSPSSGPVQYLWLTQPGGAALNSVNGQSGINVHATVGLDPPLSDAQPLDPPIKLRFASDPGSENQAVDCDKNVNFRDEILNGCQNPYTENQRNGSCAGYGSGNLPQPPVAPLPGDDCIITETGDKTGQIRQAMDERWGHNGGPTCKTLNRWPTAAGQPLPPPSDPRYVTLFITDENSFGGSGNDIYPIRRFAGFYLTAADGLNCPGDDPANPGAKNAWGHFVTYVIPNPNGTASDTLCAFNDAGLCIAVLVE
jgi:hypothetical protein